MHAVTDEAPEEVMAALPVGPRRAGRPLAPGGAIPFRRTPHVTIEKCDRYMLDDLELGLLGGVRQQMLSADELQQILGAVGEVKECMRVPRPIDRVVCSLRQRMSVELPVRRRRDRLVGDAERVWLVVARRLPASRSGDGGHRPVGELAVVQRVVQAVLGEQLGVVALLDDVPSVHHDDRVRVTDR
jgi:hypothetical protein